MKTVVLFILFLLTYCTSKGQTPKIVSLSDSLLKPGKYKVVANIKGFDKIITYSDSSEIEIKKNDNKITFAASKKLALLNFLIIDLKNHTVYFDNIKVTKELDIKGKFYAPNLIGIESHMSKVVSSKPKTDISDFAFILGTNTGETRPTICLGYVKPLKGQQLLKPEFLTITIL